MARFLAYPLLELKTFWKRPLNPIMFAIFALMTLGLVAGGVQVRSGSADTGGAKLAINAAFNLAFVDVVLFSLILPFYIAVSCGMPLLADFDRKIDRLIAATPISHVGYAFSRFFGAFGVVCCVMSAWCVAQMALYQLWPINVEERIRIPFDPGAYVAPLLLFALPLALFTGGISMWLGVRTRQPVLVFALPVVIVISGIFFVWSFNPEWLPRWVDRLMQGLDPTGFRWFRRTYLTEDRGVAFYNSASISPDALFGLSRLGFACLGLLAVWATGRRLSRTEHADLRVGDPKRLLEDAAHAASLAPPTDHAAIAARGGNPATTVQPPGWIRSTLHILWYETWALLRSPGVWLFGPLILLETWGATSFRQGTLDTEVLMTTGAGAAGAFNTLTVLLCLLTLFYSVESLVREERCGLATILRAAPVPTASILAGKVLANAMLALVLIACTAVGIGLVILVQTVKTGISVGFELPVLLLILGALLSPTLIVWCAYTSFLYAVLRNRFVVYGLALATFVVTGLLTQFDYMNWLTAWHLWNVVQWSELDRLSFMWEAIIVNRLVVLALAAFLIVAALSFWPRRTPDLRAIADRMRPAALLRALLAPALAAIPLIVLGFYSGLAIRAGYEGAPQRNAQKSYWKRNSNTWEDAPVPALDDVDAQVKLFPETRALEVTGTYVLRNPHLRAMAEIPLTVGPHFQTSDWTVDGVATDPSKHDQPAPCIENRNNLFVIRPAKPLARNETVKVGFQLVGKLPQGWSRFSAGRGEFILPSGVVLTSFSPSFLPVPGYLEGVGIDDKNRRDTKEYPPDYWKERVDPGFGPAWSTNVRLAIEGPADWVINGCGIEVESTEIEGRRRTVWQTEHPVRFFNIVGGPLQSAKGETSTVYYDRRTEHNVPTMVKALDAARHNYGEWFGAYPWTNLRVTEFPGLAGYAQGFPGNISFSEEIGYLARPVDPNAEEGNLDVAFYIVAHEAGHQWWGNIVTPGKGPGGNIISEGLAEFSALMLLHHELGEKQSRTLRRRWEQQYVQGRSADNERPINRTTGTRPGDNVVTYPRAGWAFWMLRNVMGEDALLAGLRDFVNKWRNGVETPEGLDFPLIEDLLESLRTRAPDSAAFDIYVNQWILGKVLPELELQNTEVTASTNAGEGGYVVTGKLLHSGTGAVTVRIRVIGETPSAGSAEPAVAPQQDVMVDPKPGESVTFQVTTGFKPAKIVVDPDVELLFAGRKRTEKSLSAP